MESSQDKQWASKYLLDPLTAPEPSEETGPGTHYNSTFSSNPYRQSTSSTTSSQKKAQPISVRETKDATRNNGLPSPPSSTSPHKERFPKPPPSQLSTHNRRSSDQASTQVPTSTGGQASSNAPTNRPRRTSSLSARYQGDRSHRPLEMIARDQQLAHRSPHLRKKQHIGADSIDKLDVVGGGYHHGGPFDAASLARNQQYKNSPVEAVADSNAEALKATPEEKIIDAVRKHRPLDGVAAVPPGHADREGRVYNYQEGTDLMIESGDNPYKRWDGVKYLPGDLKGKGEPSYSIERALKESKRGAPEHRRVMSDGQPAYEMVPTAPNNRARPGITARASSYGANQEQQRYSDWERERERERPRSSSGPGKGLRRRFGSLRMRGDDSAIKR
ncbi:MAG: hypothetical protein LQ338_002537 [Usnochroma carphineum]|nr:MAG: hypothetical protein LQ338_002537 [Usnochroma carphineum]